MANADFPTQSRLSPFTMVGASQSDSDSVEKKRAHSKPKFRHRLTAPFRSFRNWVSIKSGSADRSTHSHNNQEDTPKGKTSSGFVRSQSMYFQSPAETGQSSVSNVSQSRMHRALQSVSAQNLSGHIGEEAYALRGESSYGVLLNPAKRELPVMTTTEVPANHIAAHSRFSSLSQSTSVLDTSYPGLEGEEVPRAFAPVPAMVTRVHGPFRSQLMLYPPPCNRNIEWSQSLSKLTCQSSCSEALILRTSDRQALPCDQKSRNQSEYLQLEPETSNSRQRQSRTVTVSRVKQGISAYTSGRTSQLQVSKKTVEQGCSELYSTEVDYTFSQGRAGDDDAKTRCKPQNVSAPSTPKDSVILNRCAAENLIRLCSLVKAEGCKKREEIGKQQIDIEQLKKSVSDQLELQRKVHIADLFEPFSEGRCLRMRSTPLLVITIEGKAKIKLLQAPQELAIIPLYGAFGLFKPQDLEEKRSQRSLSFELKTFLIYEELFASPMVVNLINQLNRRDVYTDVVLSIRSFTPDAERGQPAEFGSSAHYLSAKGGTWV